MACALALLAGRALAGGGFDPGFSGDGKRTADFGGTEDVRAVTTIGSRKIVVAGIADASGDEALVRLRP